VESSVVRVEIYVKTTCGYCYRAQQLLDSKGVEYETYALEWGSPLRAEMIQRSGGRTTVPQIFIDGRHIGGCVDLYALERQGKLEQLLKAA
jgi:glutaredoxin 3